MNWALQIQLAINDTGGLTSGTSYFTGTHFTVPVTYTREITKHIDNKIKGIIDSIKDKGYTYTIEYTKPNKPK